MKKYIFTIILIFLVLNSLFFPSLMLEVSKTGIWTWFYQVLPSLLPFTILSGIFLRSKWINALSIKTGLLPITIILICGTMFGFPVGAKLSSDFYKQGYIGKSQAEILCVCTNNFSPMYLNGVVIPLLFGNQCIKLSLYMILYAIPLIIGVLLLVSLKKHPLIHKKRASRFQLDMQIIDAGIISGFETLIKICGYIVLFSLFTSFCSNLIHTSNFTRVLMLGNLEISNGIILLSKCKISQPLKYIISIQLLSFGGVCGLAQTASFMTDSNLSNTKYVAGKLVLSILLCIIGCLYYL